MKTIIRPLPFVLASTSTGTMILNHQDYQTDASGNTYGVGYQYLSKSSFDPEEIELVLHLLNLRRERYGDGVVALDCGANIGAHTIVWGIEMTDWGSVISFEAQERIYYALAGNVAINNCFNVKAVHAALGNVDLAADKRPMLDIPIVDYTKHASFGSLELKFSEKNEFIGQKIDYTKTQKVPLVSIDSLELPRIDLMKMDVEGMEEEVLNGAMNSIRQHKPILCVEILKSGGKKISNMLKPLGYEFFTFDINLLAIHKDDLILSDIAAEDPSDYRLMAKRLWNAGEKREAVHNFITYLKKRGSDKTNGDTYKIKPFHPQVDESKF